MNERIREAARLFGSMGGKAPKTLTDTDRERRRKWAKGLAVIRAAKAAGKTQWRVIARDGSEHTVWSMTGGTALEEARAKGIDAVGVEKHTAKQKGNGQ